MRPLKMMTLDELRRLARERGVLSGDTLDRDALVLLLGALAPSAETTAALTPEPLHRRPSALPTSVLPARPADYDSETMARVYLEQGAFARAVEIFRQLCAARPNDKQLAEELDEAERLADLQAKKSTSSTPRTPGEPFGMLDFEELPDAYGVDEVEVMFKDPFQVFAYWEITDDGMKAARARLGGESDQARLVLRMFSTTGAGELSHTRDYLIEAWRGRRYLSSPRGGVRVRMATGLVAPSGLFALIAHSTVLRVPPADLAPVEVAAVEWIEVRPGETRGAAPEPIEIVRRVAPAPGDVRTHDLDDESLGFTVDAEGRPVRRTGPRSPTKKGAR